MKTSGTYSYRNIWRVAYPILISLVMEQMIGLTDTAFLGRVGEVELGETGSEQYYVVDKRDPEKIDNTHITHSGAEIVAKFIADELVRLGVWTR